jgi:HNH endonuclease
MAVVCRVEGCGQVVRCKGVCNKHYHVMKNARKPQNPCGCGCGETTIYDFVWGHHTRLFTNEEQSRRAHFNDGSTQRDRGLCEKTYRKIRGRHEHRIVAEQKIGRPLEPGEIVHHKNERIRDNSPDNLEVMTRAEHMAEHREAIVAGLRRYHGN